MLAFGHWACVGDLAPDYARRTKCSARPAGEKVGEAGSVAEPRRHHERLSGMRTRNTTLLLIGVFAGGGLGCGSTVGKQSLPSNPLVSAAEPSSAAGRQPPANARLQPFSAVRTDGDDRHLVVAFTGSQPGSGPCQAEYDGYASVLADRINVTIAVRARAEPTETTQAADSILACDVVAYPRVVSVEVPEPIAGRQIVDTSDRSVHVAYDGTLLVPIDPLIAAAEETGTSTGNSWTRTYRSDDTLAFQITQTSLDVEATDRDMVVIDRVIVHDQQADVSRPRSDQSGVAQLRWTEADQAMIIRAFPAKAGISVPTEALTSFAAKLTVAASLPHGPTATTNPKSLPTIGRVEDLAVFATAVADDALAQLVLGMAIHTPDDLLENLQTATTKLSSPASPAPQVEAVGVGPVQHREQIAIFRITTAAERRLVAVTVRTADPPVVAAIAYAHECGSTPVSVTQTCP